MPGKTIIKGHYALNLRGWDHSSIWGVDGRWGHLFAQLWRNGDGERDDDPHIWITPPAWPETRDLAELARQIARATRCPEDDAAYAIAESLGWTHHDHPPA